MSWYRFEEGNPKGILRIKSLQVAWYDIERNGDCFDESFIFPSEDIKDTFHSLGMMLTYVEIEEDANKIDRSRVFVHMDNGDMYELKMKKLSKEQERACSNFYGGKYVEEKKN